MTQTGWHCCTSLLLLHVYVRFVRVMALAGSYIILTDSSLILHIQVVCRLLCLPYCSQSHYHTLHTNILSSILEASPQ